MPNPFVASISLTYKICNKSRYFFLPELDMVRVERKLVTAVQRMFPLPLQKQWGNIVDAPVQEWRGFESGAKIKAFLDVHLAELTPPSGMMAPCSCAMRDDECWICEIKAGEHICRRCSALYAGGSEVAIEVDSPLGPISAPVSVELDFNCDRYIH
jgi:hypothetical protein